MMDEKITWNTNVCNWCLLPTGFIFLTFPPPLFSHLKNEGFGLCTTLSEIPDFTGLENAC